MIPRITLLLAFATITSLPAALAAQDQAEANDGAAVVNELLITRFYPLGELVTPPRHFPLRSDTSPAVRQPSVYNYSSNGFGGAGGGGLGGGGGGFGGGGQGMFSVPVAPQFGGMGGGGGFGGAIDFGIQQQSIPVTYTEEQHEAIINLIMDNIEQDSWEDNGGRGSITSVNNTLVIRQTKAVHEQTAAFLKELREQTVGGQPLSLDVWWIPANAGTKRIWRNGWKPIAEIVRQRCRLWMNSMNRPEGTTVRFSAETESPAV